MPINDVASATFSKTLLPLVLLLLPLSVPVTAGVVALFSGAVVAGTAVVMVAVVSLSARLHIPAGIRPESGLFRFSHSFTTALQIPVQRKK